MHDDWLICIRLSIVCRAANCYCLILHCRVATACWLVLVGGPYECGSGEVVCHLTCMQGSAGHGAMRSMEPFAYLG